MIKLEKLTSLLSEITREKGELTLFALFLRDNSVDMWDLVVAGPWYEKDQRAGLAYLSKKVNTRLTTPELLSLSRIIILEKDNPVLQAILDAVPPKQDKAKLHNFNFHGLQIKHAYIFHAKKAWGGGNAKSSVKRRKKAIQRAAV
jgi:hypothetical protein